MRVISIHSHKGGAGKTTLTLMVAKAQAKAGRKVCAVDLDFIGSGFEHLLDVQPPVKFLDHYISKDPGSPNLPKVEEMITPYSDGDLGNYSMDLVFNLAGSAVDNERNDQDKSVSLLGMEPASNIAGRSINRFLPTLESMGYDTVILDCHPGLAYLSKSLLRYGKKSPFQEHIFLFVTTLNRAHFYGLINELNTLAAPEYGNLFNSSQSILCLNRTDPRKYGRWKDLMAYTHKVIFKKDQALSRMSTFEEICQKGGGMNYICINDSEAVTKWGDIGGGREILLPGQDDIRYTDTPLCKRAFKGL
jgi:hypothetical protein